MITELQNIPSSNILNNIKPYNPNRNITILASKNTINKLVDSGICSQCFQKDSMIYPGSSFSLCIPCDKKISLTNKEVTPNKTLNDNKHIKTKEKVTNYLISLGICPQCRKKDPMLYSGSSFRTCLPCDFATRLNCSVISQTKSDCSLKN